MSLERHSESTLRQCYQRVDYLGDYLTRTLDPLHDPGTGLIGHSFRPRHQDLQSYSRLVSTTLVAVQKVVHERKFKAYKPSTEMSMINVIDKVQEKLLKARTVGHIITAGYRLSSSEGDKGKQGMERLGITNYYVNTIVTMLQKFEWEILLQRIGNEAMLHLLSETSLFICLPNDCYCQITGKSILYLTPSSRHSQEKRSSDSVVEGTDERPTKRVKVDGQKSPPATAHKAADVVFARLKMFYSRPTYVPNKRRLAVGLPPRHFLNQILPSFGPASLADPEPRTQAEHTRLAAKYIFPRQYGMSNPFQVRLQNKRSIAYRHTIDREAEIKDKGPCKTPKRIKDLLVTLDQMIWKHRKCGYKPLLNIACPSKTNIKKLDSSVILEMMSEQSISLQSQSSSSGHISVVSGGASLLSSGLSEARHFAKAKPRFAEFACDYYEVYRYVALVTKAVIPSMLWGSRQNFRLILHYVEEFISSRRYESPSLHHIIQGFRISDCDWLMPPGLSSQKHRVSASDANKRRELLEDFLFWYFDGFILPLLKTTFYITDSSAFRNRLLYFRHDDWETLCAPLIARLTMNTFVKVTKAEVTEILKIRKLGFSSVRLLPKETGVRPIVNLSQRKPLFRLKGWNGTLARRNNSSLSINQVLQATFQILKFEKHRQSSHLGASIFRPDDVYTKLKAFKSKLPCDTEGRLPKLYFVKVDVQACFDTINQRELLKIIEKLISDDGYTIQRHGQVRTVAGKVTKKVVKRAIEDDHPHFVQYAIELARSLRGVIFADEVVYRDADKEEILQLLRDHITDNIVKIDSDYYRQVVGIPQGSILSSLLCSFFYGDMEKEFGSWTNHPQSVLFRLIDDYLYITSSLSKAKSFLDMMKQGHPKYGCFISQEKTLTNFDYDHQMHNVMDPNQTAFPWCGFLIDTQKLTITVDYPRYFGVSLNDSLTICRSRNPGLTFAGKMLQFAKTRSHIIYTDKSLNGEHVVYLNIYQNFLLLAMKMHTYLRGKGLGGKKNESFIFRTVQNVLHHTYVAIKRRGMKKVATDSGAECDAKKAIIIWLGNHAFYTILLRKRQHYRELPVLLQHELSRKRYRRYKGRFQSLTKEGEMGVAKIEY